MKGIKNRIAAIALTGTMVIGSFAVGSVTSVAADTDSGELFWDLLALGIADEMTGGYLGDLFTLGLLDEAYRQTYPETKDYGEVTLGPEDVDYAGVWTTHKELGFGVYGPANWELDLDNPYLPEGVAALVNTDNYEEFVGIYMEDIGSYITTDYIISRLKSNGPDEIGKAVVNGMDAVYAYSHEAYVLSFVAPNDPSVLCLLVGKSNDNDLTALDIMTTVTRI